MIATTRAAWSRAQTNARLEELAGDLAAVRSQLVASLPKPVAEQMVTTGDAVVLFAHALHLAATDLQHYEDVARGERSA